MRPIGVTESVVRLWEALQKFLQLHFERALLRTRGFSGASGEATARGVNLYEDMELPADKRRQWEAHVPSKTDENVKHTVSTTCRPRVFRIALFKGFPNVPHIPPPVGHTVGTHTATITTTSENPPSWCKTQCPQEICLANDHQSRRFNFNKGALCLPVLLLVPSSVLCSCMGGRELFLGEIVEKVNSAVRPWVLGIVLPSKRYRHMATRICTAVFHSVHWCSYTCQSRILQFLLFLPGGTLWSM